MIEIEVSCCESIDQVDRTEWDSIVPASAITNTHAYLRAIEKSGINDFRYLYLMFHREKELVAHVSVGIFQFGLDIMLQAGAVKSFISLIKRKFPSFLRIKLIECGHPTALGTTFVVSDEKDMPLILALVNREMESLAKREGTSLLAIRDVSTADQKSFYPLLSWGYKITPNMANTFFQVQQKSFQEYLDDLVAKRRHEILQRLQVFHDQGCVIEKVVDYASRAGDLTRLWQQTYNHATEYQREILNEKYFRYLSDFLGERSFALLCTKGERLIGFTVLLDSGDTLISTYCGLDYELNRSTYAYFVLFYKSIEEAISLGKKWLELGVTNYNPKIEIGAMPELLDIYARSTNPIVNLFFVPLMRLTTTSPQFDKRRIFNRRYYDRHRIREETSALIGWTDYRIEDVSLGGLGLTGDAPLRRGRYWLTIAVEHGFSVRLRVAVRVVERLKDSRWKIGVKIVKMRGEYLLRWHDYVRRNEG